MATVIVSIGHESTTLLVAGGGACEFTRVFDWGGGALQDAVMQELDVPHAEAATVLRHLSLSGPGRLYESLTEDARRKATEAVRLTALTRRQGARQLAPVLPDPGDSLGIGEIVITGGTSHLEGLGEALHQMIGVSVRVGDPLARVTLATEIEAGIEASIGSMAVPIGLAIEDERTRSVNLLPTDAQATESKRPSLVKIAVPVAVAVPVVALGLMFVSAHGKVGNSQAELDAVQAQIDALPTPRRPVIDVSLQGSQAQRAQAVASVLVNRVSWDAVLHDISRVLPATSGSAPSRRRFHRQRPGGRRLPLLRPCRALHPPRPVRTSRATPTPRPMSPACSRGSRRSRRSPTSRSRRASSRPRARSRSSTSRSLPT